MLKIEELVKTLDVFTRVEIIKTGDRTIFSGKVKDIKIQDLEEFHIYKIMPCSTSRETYLEIDVY